MLRLDGSITSALDWKDPLAQAESTPGPLHWHLDLGLFATLKRGLTHSADFHALLLALDHFKANVWNRFSERTQQVVIYRGTLDFSHAFPWDATQEENFRLTGRGNKRRYCVAAAAEYLRLLVQKMPDEIPLSLYLDATSIADPFEKALLLNPEPFSRFQLDVQGAGPWQIDSLAALCLPLTDSCAAQVRQIPEPCRLIPESALVYSWDGLERIYYDPAALNALAMRKLQGFSAAGGELISLAS